MSLQVIAKFNKIKKITEDIRTIAAALESSELLVVERKSGKHYRVRRKVLLYVHSSGLDLFCFVCPVEILHKNQPLTT